MKLNFLIAFILLLSTPMAAQYLWQIYPDTVIRWNYYDGDEFNRAEVDSKKWSIGFPWSRSVISQDTYFMDNNVILKNGNAHFLLKKENNSFPLHPSEIDTIEFKKNKIKLTDGNKYPFKYTGGLIWSKKQYKYGYFEIKFKAPEGRGMWPAFWLYGGNPNYEIDFFELKGEKQSSIHVDTHCPTGCNNYREFLAYRKSWGHWIETNQKLTVGFNVVAGEWTHEGINWFLNGELIAHSDIHFDVAMNLSAGTGIAKDGGPFKPGPNSSTIFPSIFEVDYIRIYKRDTIPTYENLMSSYSFVQDTIGVQNNNNFKAEKNSKRLKNNSDRTIKNRKIITLSVLPTSFNTISVRVLGRSKKDQISIQLMDSRNTIIKDLTFTENQESTIFNVNDSIIRITAKVNNQTITETLRMK